jgi:uncharacterized membrane protein YjjP (DUF1212 family)
MPLASTFFSPPAEAGAFLHLVRPADGGEARELVFGLARGLHTCGVPAPQLEETAERVARARGVEAQILSNPTTLFATFGPGGAGETRIARVRPGEFNLQRLSELGELIDALESGHEGASDPLERLEEILTAPPPYGAAVTALGFGVASATAAVLFGGSGADLLASLALGVATGLLAIRVSARGTFSPVFELLAALLVALLAAVGARLGLPLDERIVTLAGLIVLVPGYTLTVAMTEITTRHLTSGTTRLTGAVGTLLAIGLGVGIASRLAELVGDRRLVEAAGAPSPGMLVAALLLLPLAFLVLFQARRRDAGWITAAGILAFLGARVGATALGPELGAGLGALLLGIAGNLVARLTGRPASVLLVPGIMLLVPGSIGFESVASFLEHDALSGIEAAFRMALVATGLAGGLLLANVLVEPRRRL